MSQLLRRLMPDSFVLMLLLTVAAASLLPVRGAALDVIGQVSTAAIALLFFLHGVRISPEAVVAGAKHWRLQLAILLFGYGAMAVAGFGFASIAALAIAPAFALGFVYLGVLPTTVQSSIAYTSLARGNVAAAVIASAASNILGVLLAPALFALLASAQGGDVGLSAIGRIATILLLPFALGQLTRRWLSGWAERNKRLVSLLDRATIVLAVYVAFAEAVNGGIWSRIGSGELALIVALVCALMASAFTAAWALGGVLRLNREDRATLLFAGAHKSIATGAPMARILFPGAEAGAVLLPLLLYHQLQLMLSAVVAPRLAQQGDDAPR